MKLYYKKTKHFKELNVLLSSGLFHHLVLILFCIMIILSKRILILSQRLSRDYKIQSLDITGYSILDTSTSIIGKTGQTALLAPNSILV